MVPFHRFLCIDISSERLCLHMGQILVQGAIVRTGIISTNVDLYSLLVTLNSEPTDSLLTKICSKLKINYRRVFLKLFEVPTEDSNSLASSLIRYSVDSYSWSNL